MRFKSRNLTIAALLTFLIIMRKRQKLTSQQRSEVIAILSVGCSRAAAARCIRCTPYMLRREILENASFAEQVVWEKIQKLILHIYYREYKSANVAS